MEKSGILKEHNFERVRNEVWGQYGLIKGINLQPHIKLDGGPPDSEDIKEV